MNVAAWLAELGLEQYAQSFAKHGIDALVLPRLDAADLHEIGVRAVGHRRRLLDAIAGLGLDPRAPLPNAPPATDPAKGERRQLTVMFVDIVGFTALSARLDPEELREVLRAYQNVMAGEVARFEGVVARFLGDGVLAYFGFPRAHEDNAARAVAAGLAIAEAAQHLRAPDGTILNVRIGIATGLVVIGGLIGSDAAWDQAAVGETPNLAARLQAMACPGCVVVDPVTRHLAGGLFDYADLGPQPVKGFAEPVRAWRVLGRGQAAGRFEARQMGSLAPLVGRKRELALLRRCWARARAGAGQLVLLSGEPGIGKSRLLRALLDGLAEHPYPRLHLRCSPLHASSPLYPVIDQLERAAGFARNDSAELRLSKLKALMAQGTDDVDSVAPLVAALLAIPAGAGLPAPGLSALMQRRRTEDALLAQLEGLARRHPVLVLFEDAHWSDPTSLELLQRAAERIAALPVLMVITFRREFRPPWPDGPRCTTIALDRLDVSEARTVVERLAGARQLPPEAVAQVVEKADGVPLFLEELTKAVLEVGPPPVTGDGRCDHRLAAFAIPASLQDSLVARLDRLAPVREVAQTAACLGREFSHTVLVAVSSLPEPRLVDALRQLVRAELLFQYGNPPEARYTFKHALLRDVAYTTMLNSRRRQLHARIVAVLEAQFPEVGAQQPQVLAQHCAEAALAAKAIEYWRQAGLQATRRSAMKEAVLHLRQALGLTALLPDHQDRAARELELQVALGATLLALKGESAPEIGVAYRRARALYQRIGTMAVEPAVLWGLWHFHMNRAELTFARAVADEHLRSAQERHSVVGQAVGRRCGLVVDLFAGDLAAATRHWEQIQMLPQPRNRCPDEVLIDPWITARSMISWVLLLQGQKEQALACGRAALAAARAAARPYMLAVVLHHQNVLAQLVDDHARLEEQTAELLALSRQNEFAHWHATATLLHGWTKARQGAVAVGLDMMRHGLEAKRATGSRLKIPYYTGLMADLLGRLGRPADGLRLLDDASTSVEASGEQWYAAELHRLRGRLLLDLGADQREQAAACFRTGQALAQRQLAPWWERRAATSLLDLVRAA